MIWGYPYFRKHPYKKCGIQHWLAGTSNMLESKNILTPNETQICIGIFWLTNHPKTGQTVTWWLKRGYMGPTANSSCLCLSTEKITQTARYLISETQPEWNENPTTSIMTEKSSTNWCSNLWCLYMDIWCKDPGALKTHCSSQFAQPSNIFGKLLGVGEGLYMDPPGRRKTWFGLWRLSLSTSTLVSTSLSNCTIPRSRPCHGLGLVWKFQKKISNIPGLYTSLLFGLCFLSLTIFWVNFLFKKIDRRVCLYLPSLQLTGLRTWKLMVGRGC